MRACAYRLYIFPAQAPVHVLEAFHAGKTINKAAILLVVTVAEHIGDDAILARYCTPNHADVREHNLKNFNISSISESISQYAASLYNSVYLYAHAGICCCCTCVLRVSMYCITLKDVHANACSCTAPCARRQRQRWGSAGPVSGQHIF